MRRTPPRLLFALALVLALAVAGCGSSSGASSTPAPSSNPWIGVDGNDLVDRSSDPVRLLGVNRSGTEYKCEQDTGIFEGPTDAASIAAIKSWDANAVRVPLNESCWLGINGVPARYGGAAYRQAIVGWVDRLTEAGLYVILDLQFAAPGSEMATEIVPMPDADHAPDFWRSVAETFRDDRALVFDLYNEPHDVDWDCWQHGCQTETEAGIAYRAVGMEELVKVVRETGASQPLLLSGINYAHDLRQWEAHLPPDPDEALVASLHTYDFAPCGTACRAELADLALHHPLVAAEIGETDCGHSYIDRFMSWADEHDVSYLGWAWDAGNGWTCTNGPSLIRDYDGAPTPYGIGLRDHLRELGG